MKEYIQRDINRIEKPRKKQISFIKKMNPGVSRNEIENELPNPDLSKLKYRLEAIEGMERFDELTTEVEDGLKISSDQRSENVETMMSQTDSEIESVREMRGRLFKALRGENNEAGISTNKMLKVPTFLKNRNIVNYSDLEYIPTNIEIEDEANLRSQFLQKKPSRKTISIERTILEKRKDARRKELEIRNYKIRREEARKKEIESRKNK